MNAKSHHHILKTKELEIVVGDNAADGEHEGGYNGIWQISSIHDRTPFFIPSAAGMNFEFVAPMQSVGAIEPRQFPAELIVEQEGKKATIHQSATPVHKVESWMTYEVSGPSHVDFKFRYQLRDPKAQAEKDFIGFFFASYILEPENKSLYILGRDGYRTGSDAFKWAQFCTTHQGRNAAVTWEKDAYDLPFSPHDHGLYTSKAPITYSVPLMMGRRGDMVFVVMFENPQGVVISHGMGGGSFRRDGSDLNPAWDFFLYTKNPGDNLKGEWRGRVIYKKFEDRDDILREYQKYQQSLGHRWEIPAYGK